MSPDVIPYQHRIAVENAPWLIEVLERGLQTYREILTARQEFEHLTTEPTLPTMRELCRVDAALEQLDTERRHHATRNP